MKAQKTTFRDGAVITTERKSGKYVAIITYKNGDKDVVKSTFALLLEAKVAMTIKNHYSAVIQSLAQTAREINANVRKK